MCTPCVRRCVQVVEAYTSLRVYFWLYQSLIFVLLIPYVSIRHLRMLAPFSMLANVLTVVGLSITLIHCFIDLPSTTDRPAVASIYTLPLYFGIAIFTFEVPYLLTPAHVDCVLLVCLYNLICFLKPANSLSNVV